MALPIVNGGSISAARMAMRGAKVPVWVAQPLTAKAPCEMAAMAP
jgi:hypothetical protein